MKIQLDSASPVTFLIRNVRHELKLSDPYLKIHRVGQMTADLYQTKKTSRAKSFINSVEKDREIGHVFKTFK